MVKLFKVFFFFFFILIYDNDKPAYLYVTQIIKITKKKK